MTHPVILLGAGGHARVLVDTLRAMGATVLGCVESTAERAGTAIAGVPILGKEDVIYSHSPESIRLVNGIGLPPSRRREAYERFRNRGYRFATVVAPSAILGGNVELGEGTQVLAGAILQTGARAAENCIINTRASVDHDCELAAHVHIAPGVVLCGGVKVGAESDIGAGAVVFQYLTVGSASVIGGGAIVTKNVGDFAKVYGNPAREVHP